VKDIRVICLCTFCHCRKKYQKGLAKTIRHVGFCGWIVWHVTFPALVVGIAIVLAKAIKVAMFYISLYFENIY
jgi:hypothetical protein